MPEWIANGEHREVTQVRGVPLYAKGLQGQVAAPGQHCSGDAPLEGRCIPLCPGLELACLGIAQCCYISGCVNVAHTAAQLIVYDNAVFMLNGNTAAIRQGGYRLRAGTTYDELARDHFLLVGNDSRHDGDTPHNADNFCLCMDNDTFMSDVF